MEGCITELAAAVCSILWFLLKRLTCVFQHWPTGYQKGGHQSFSFCFPLVKGGLPDIYSFAVLMILTDGLEVLQHENQTGLNWGTKTQAGIEGSLTQTWVYRCQVAPVGSWAAFQELVTPSGLEQKVERMWGTGKHFCFSHSHYSVPLKVVAKLART